MIFKFNLGQKITINPEQSDTGLDGTISGRIENLSGAPQYFVSVLDIMKYSIATHLVNEHDLMERP